MGTFIPNTKEEQLKMLNEIGYADFDDLFKDIPAEARVQGELNLPKGKSEIEVGEALGDIESVKAVEDVLSPVSATVLEVNEELLDAPEAINEHPYDAWFVRVGNITETEELLDEEAYDKFVEEEEA